MVPTARSVQGQELLRASLPALLLALFVLVGRTGVGRFLPFVPNGVLGEMRLWVVLVFVLGLGWAGSMRFPRVNADVTRTFYVVATTFYCYMELSALWAPDPAAAAMKAYDLGLILVVCAVLYRVFEYVDGPTFVAALWASVVCLAGALAAIALLQFMTAGGTARLAVLGGGPNVFGRNMALLCFGALYFWRKGRMRALWLSLAGLSGMLVVLSGSRGAIVALVMALAAYAIVARLRARQVLLAAVWCAVGIAPLLAFSGLGRAVLAMWNARVVRLLVAGVYASGRDRIYRAAVQIFAGAPLQGIGLSGFRFEGFIYPHNLFLETSVEGGVVGALLIGAMLVVWFVMSWRIRAALCPSLTASAVFALIAAQFSGDLFDVRAVPVFMLLSLAGATPGHASTDHKPASPVVPNYRGETSEV